MKQAFLIFLILGTTSSYAELSTYKSTDNEGMSRGERFDSIEKYMIELSNTVRSLESKIDENSKKLKDFETTIKSVKDDTKKRLDQLGERPDDNGKNTDEMKKLKADFLVLKNKDIEKMKLDIADLYNAVKALPKN